ncbi:MAG: hypothetical protein HYX92_07310 [Chloroflexi bacterium]|nr:hypothetical protein [Chloroflexota bacterium]
MVDNNLRKAAGVISILTLAALILSACAPTATPGAKPGGPAPTPKPGAETPKYGGTLTTYIGGNPPSLDAHQEPTLITSQIVAPFYNTIVQIDPLTADKFVPALAEKWEISQDALTWTFDLRQGVKFHDGTPFTVDDAIFTLQRLIAPPKGIVSNMQFLLKPAVKAVSKDGNKLKMTLNYPFAVMLDTLGYGYTLVYSQKYLQDKTDMKTSAMGTGPFKFKEYSPGVGLEGVKNPDFWVKGRPYLDGFRFLIIKDQATRESAFRTGKVNMTGKQMAALTPEETERLKKENSELTFHRSPTLQGSWVILNTRRPPFQDQRVRKAVSLAFDRQAAVKTVGQGVGLISKPLPVAPWGIPMDELLNLPGYRQPKDKDIADAKKLMADAGHANGFNLAILTRQMWMAKDAAVFLTDQFAKVGIKANVQTLEDALLWETGRKLAYDALVYLMVWPFTDPHYMGRYWVPGNAVNYSGNDDDKELAQMWDEQIKIADPAKRKALIRKVEEHLLDALPGISIVWYVTFVGLRPEVRNFYPGVSDYVGNTLQEVWLAK